MDAFYGEIRAFPYTFVPVGWMPCDGRSLSMAQYQILASVIGTTFGGNSSTFNLPDLRGIAVVGAGADAQGFDWTMSAKVYGTPTVSLTQAQMPQHDHVLQTQAGPSRLTMPSSSATVASAQYNNNGTLFNYQTFRSATSTPAPEFVTMADASVGVTGTGATHENHSPFLVMWYCINVNAPDSIYPVRD